MARALSVLALLLAVVVAGCGGDGGADRAGAPRPVSLQLFGDPAELAVYRELVAAYRRETGGTVRLIEVGDRKDHLAKLTASFAARRPPDLVLLNHRNMGAFAARGVLEPVGPRMERPGGLERGAFFDVALRAFEVGGALQCVPQNASSLVVYVNEDLFRRAGVPLPRGPWRYAEFLDAARRLTRDGVRGVAIDPGTIRFAPFVWGAGGELVDDAGAPTRFTLDTPAARRGLEALLRLQREGLAPTRKEAAARAVDERFLAGDVAMYLSSRRDVPTLRTIRSFSWDVAPLPVLERPASVLHSDGLCLAKAGRTDDAWRFVEFALGPQGARILARGGRTVPSLRAVAESSAFLDPSRPPRSGQVFLDQIATMRRLPTTAGWTRLEETVDLALEEAYYGSSSLDEALRRIDAETRGRF